MLSTTWLYLMVVMIVGSIVKGFVFGQIIWVSIDLVVLGVCYLILRRRYWVDMRQSMIFLSVITVISILADIGLISGMFATMLNYDSKVALLLGSLLGLGEKMLASKVSEQANKILKM